MSKKTGQGKSGLLLKYLLSDLKIRQRQFGKTIPKPDGSGGYGKTMMSFVCNGNWERFPSDPNFRHLVEQELLKNPEVNKYLARKGYDIKDIWNEVKNGGRVKAGGRKKNEDAAKARAAANAAGSREIELIEEVEMLSVEARKVFKLMCDPFQHEISSEEDIFLSEEHRYMFYAMRDAAMNGGFMAIKGEVGSGKSVARKWLEAALAKEDSVKIISAVALDKSALTAPSLCDAIIYDLSQEAPKSGPEKKARQVRRLLLDRARAGVKIVLIIEEAHDLNVKAFKLLKRLHEIDDGYKKTLGIILIGQPELGTMLNANEHPEMREVIHRCQVANIGGLNGSIETYLDHKFSRKNLDRKKYITDDAVKALGERLTLREGRKVISYAYPLMVNNYVVRAINWAAEHGFKVVSEEVINNAL